MKINNHNGQLRVLGLLFTVLLISVMTSFVVAEEPMKVAITVDDLPTHADTTDAESRLNIAKRFIAVLKKHEIVEAYGFTNSKKVSEHPETKETLLEWVKAGYPLGNHSYSHMDLTKNTAKDFLADVKSGESLVRELSPWDTSRWFRYPFLHEGNTLEKRNAVRSELAQMNYQIAQVTIDFEDWAWNTPYVRCVKQGNKKALEWLEKSYLEHSMNRLNLAKTMSKSLFHRQMKHILLLHIGLFDSLMLDKLLTAYKSAGVQFITLAEAGADEAYQEDPMTTLAQGGTLLDQLFIARKLSYPKVPKLPFKDLQGLCL